MNPGIVDEVGQTARATVTALQSTPVVLGVLLFNVMFMALVGWSGYENGKRWERLLTASLKCVNSDFKLQSSESAPFEFPKQTPPPIK